MRFAIMRAMRLLAILMLQLFSINCMFIQSAYALDNLKFETGIKSPSLRLQMDVFLQGFYKTDSRNFDIASLDLNGDGIDEYILKRKSCTQAQSICTHLVLADQKTKMRLLSSIRAKHIMVGATSNYGVNDLLAFENNINEYDFDIYMWSPEEKMYILKAESNEK